MPHTDVIESLSAGVDKNGVPVGFEWHVRRTFTDETGNVLGETRVTVRLTREELAEHISAALVKQAGDIAQDSIVRDGIASERDEARAQVRQLEADAKRLKQEHVSALHALSEREGAKIAALAQERDALAAQARDLAAQIVEMQKPPEPPPAEPPEERPA